MQAAHRLRFRNHKGSVLDSSGKEGIHLHYDRNWQRKGTRGKGQSEAGRQVQGQPFWLQLL